MVRQGGRKKEALWIREFEKEGPATESKLSMLKNPGAGINSVPFSGYIPALYLCPLQQHCTGRTDLMEE